MIENTLKSGFHYVKKRSHPLNDKNVPLTLYIRHSTGLCLNKRHILPISHVTFLKKWFISKRCRNVGEE